MTVNLKGRSFCSMKDFSADEIREVLSTARRLKQERRDGKTHPLLSGKTLAMIFQKPSLRTRVSFEAGMTQLGGHAIYLAPTDIKLGQRETTEDIGLVLSRYADIIMSRTFGHEIVEDLARYATVPVINGLSDREHPCQVLADLQTIEERKQRFEGLKLTYVGDGNNMAHSLMYAAAILGMNITVAAPPGFEPLREITADAQAISSRTGSNVVVTNDPSDGCRDADVVYTDVWASMGQESEADSRRQSFQGFQINRRLLSVAKPDCTILHCLPAHYGDEIDYETSRLPNSAIFDQAENRLHAQKALMVLLAR